MEDETFNQVRTQTALIFGHTLNNIGIAARNADISAQVWASATLHALTDALSAHISIMAKDAESVKNLFDVSRKLLDSNLNRALQVKKMLNIVEEVGGE